MYFYNFAIVFFFQIKMILKCEYCKESGYFWISLDGFETCPFCMREAISSPNNTENFGRKLNLDSEVAEIEVNDKIVHEFAFLIERSLISLKIGKYANILHQKIRAAKIKYPHNFLVCITLQQSLLENGFYWSYKKISNILGFIIINPNRIYKMHNFLITKFFLKRLITQDTWNTILKHSATYFNFPPHIIKKIIKNSSSKFQCSLKILDRNKIILNEVKKHIQPQKNIEEGLLNFLCDI